MTRTFPTDVSPSQVSRISPHSVSYENTSLRDISVLKNTKLDEGNPSGKNFSNKSLTFLGEIQPIDLGEQSVGAFLGEMSGHYFFISESCLKRIFSL